MKCRIPRISDYLLVAAGLLLFTTQFAHANDGSQLSGSYQVLQKNDRGPQTHVRLQLHLNNLGQRDLHIRRLTLWDLPHAGKGAIQSCSIVVLAASSADTTQEFTIPRSEYKLWQRGVRPRLVLQVEAPASRGTMKVVHLDRISGGKVN
jgi:hypothetical protein